MQKTILTSEFKSQYLDTLNQHVLILDGAMGTNLQLQGLTATQFGSESLCGCNDCLVLTTPQAVEKVHRSFLDVGVDIIETNTFRANRISLQEYGLQDRVIEINRSSAQLALRLAKEYSSPQQPRFVAGSIGPTGQLLSSSDPVLCHFSFDEISACFQEQAVALISGGVDFLLIETSQDILEVKAAIIGAQQAFYQSGITLPLQVQVTLDTNGRMLLGTDISAVLAILEGMPIDIIGLNCSTGPEHMRESIRYLTEHTALPVSCSPNAGLPTSQDGQAIYPLQPQQFADEMTRFVHEFGINIAGGCCGTTPDHLRLLVQKAGNTPAPRRQVTPIPALASAMTAVHMHQQPAPFLIGERLNSQGSRQFKELLLKENWNAILDLALRQVENGAHALDLCTALTEKDNEADSMGKIVKLLSSSVDAPLVIDTTDPQVMEAALKNAPGRCLLNSIHLEGGRAKADRIFALARQFNASVICLTIDEKGMARTAQHKLEVAQYIYKIATQEHGLRPSDLVFDPLTFTLGSGDVESADSALHTIQAIKLIKKEMPAVFTSLGVSNVSFGLAGDMRNVLNSAMLYHCVKAGLDIAILNPAQITPYPEIPDTEKKLAEDLLFHRNDQALAKYINHFKGRSTFSVTRESAAPWKSLPLKERLSWRVINRVEDGIEAEIDELVYADIKTTVHENALQILNSILLPAMQLVGQRFGEGEIILPFVLQSAEVMKTAIAHLEQYLEKSQAGSKGRIVLATVYGDVHDIGKNLVKTILANNGYEVIDLGKQVPAEKIITAAIEAKADAIGLSALLVNTSQQMALIVNELAQRGHNFPVLVGGAAINADFARRIAITADGCLYQPGVYYCRDPFDALVVLGKMKHPGQPLPSSENTGKITNSANAFHSMHKTQLADLVESVLIPSPPFWGARTLSSVALEDVLVHLNKKALFRLSWGAKNAQGEKWEKLGQEFEKRLKDMLAELRNIPWLELSAVYGYWPTQSQDNSLLIYSPEPALSNSKVEIGQLTFPRQSGENGICLSDYFASVKSGKMDLVAFQVVTTGRQAVEHVNQLNNAGDVVESYFAHGLAVQLTEALANTIHAHIRSELNLSEKQSQRYSWGYPVMPDLSQHTLVFDLLQVRQELGMSLTSAYQMVPEFSTAAMIVHHPRAQYFSMHPAD